MKRTFLIVASAIASTVLGSSNGYAEDRLRIGDPAPRLDVEHWLSLGKGKYSEVQSFTPEKVYVIEFWATWCGPCIKSMPHLAELQEKYASDGLQIVSITDDTPEAVDKLMARKAENARGDDKTYADITSHYTLASDPDQSVAKDYMMATRQSGIPCAFIVGRDSKLEWVGHPGNLEEPLAQVLDGTWDRAKFANEFEDQQRLMDLQMEMSTIASGLPESSDPGVLLKALTPVLLKYEKLITTPSIRQDIVATKLQLMVVAAPADPETVKLLKGLMTSESVSPVFKHDMAWKIYEISMEQDDYNKEILQTAADAVPSILSQLNEESQATVLDTLAHLVHRLGNTTEALKIAEEAYRRSGERPEFKVFVDQLNKELKK